MKIIATLVLGASLCGIYPVASVIPPPEYEITGYCKCVKCCGKWTNYPTKSGIWPEEGITMAVDPKVIPLGREVYIEGVGIRTAQDTGSAIKGRRIDLYFKHHEDALRWGRQRRKVITQEYIETYVLPFLPLA